MNDGAIDQFHIGHSILEIVRIQSVLRFLPAAEWRVSRRQCSIKGQQGLCWRGLSPTKL